MPVAALKTPADIGALIRDSRLTHGLDQAGLAKQVGVSRLWINQVERGKPRASVGLILRTLIVLGIELTPGETRVSAGASDIDSIIEGVRDG